MKSTLSLALLCMPLAVPPANAQPASQTASATESAKGSDQEKNMEAYLLLLRTDVRKRKAEVVSAVMQLDVEDAEAFWPIYREFETELMGIYDQALETVRKYREEAGYLSESMADDFGTKILDLEQQRNDMKRRYYVRIKTSLDPIVAMRFLEVENQIERIMDLQIASELPVVQRNQQ